MPPDAIDKAINGAAAPEQRIQGEVRLGNGRVATFNVPRDLAPHEFAGLVDVLLQVVKQAQAEQRSKRPIAIARPQLVLPS